VIIVKVRFLKPYREIVKNVEIPPDTLLTNCAVLVVSKEKYAKFA